MMNMSSSFRGYGKVDAAEQAKLEEARRKTRKRVIIISISSVILVCVVVAAVLGTSHNSGGNSADQPLSSSIKAICEVTLYPDTCSTSLAPLAHSSHIQPIDAFKLATQVAFAELQNVADKYFSEQSNFNGTLIYHSFYFKSLSG
jgi:hypothetical protein